VPGALDAYLDFFERATASEHGLSAEMIYWERPQGGRVFNAGAVGASWVLHADPAFAALLANVLAHFGIPLPSEATSTIRPPRDPGQARREDRKVNPGQNCDLSDPKTAAGRPWRAGSP
jgi:hypothetical protein